jgi:hypothetical protein
MAPVVECLPSKLKVLSSTPSAAKKEERNILFFLGAVTFSFTEICYKIKYFLLNLIALSKTT